MIREIELLKTKTNILAIAYPVTTTYSIAFSTDPTKPQRKYLFISECIEQELEAILTALDIQKKYINVTRTDSVTYFTLSRSTLNILPSKQSESEETILAKSLQASHKQESKNGILQFLSGNNHTYNKLFESILAYVYADRFSFWVHNSYTDHLVCISTNDDTKIDRVLKPDEPNNTHLDFLKSQKKCEKREVLKDAAVTPFTDGYRSLTRIRIELSNNTLGILNISSKKTAYYLRDDTIELIKSLVVYAHSIRHAEKQEKFVSLGTIFNKHMSLDLAKSCNSISKNICKYLHFEGCSIFLEHDNNLVLAGSWDQSESRSQDSIVYSLEQASLTTNVFKSKTIFCSYDINEERGNSKTYQELTTLTPANWIGIPILIEDNRSIGVLRVRSKYEVEREEKKLKHIRNSDIEYLINVANNIAFHYQSIRKHVELADKAEELELKAKSTENRLKLFEDHTRIFLHEVRTPTQSFLNSPKIILRYINRSKLQLSADNIILKRLKDLQILANRLSFVVKCQRREHLFRDISLKEISVLHDVVLPVVNTYGEYLEREYGVSIWVDREPMKGKKIIGDPKLLTMVVNILIDNAGKYSKSKKSIMIKGKTNTSRGTYSILVENDGYEIFSHEVEDIFQDTVRGRNASELTIDGTGVGLNLAKDILERCNSKITLTNFVNPVTFVVEIPEANR